jgi:hypothetical protein
VAALLTLAVFVALAVAGLLSTRRWMRRRGVHASIDNGVTGWIFSAILSMYGITIGLTAVASWSNAVGASDVASREAAEIAALYRDIGGYPDPTRGELRGWLRRYLDDVLVTAWPAHRRGEVPHGGTALLSGFQHALHRFEPATSGQQAIHGEALGAFNRLVEVRRQRLEAVRGSVPGALWGVVLVGAVIAIGASYVFALESVSLHATMAGLLASMIALLVFFIAVTDRPFRGAAGLDPDAYELVQRDLVDIAGR